MTDRTVGIIGLGIMGGAIARNLIARGWAVIGFDTEPSRRSELERSGVTIADSKRIELREIFPRVRAYRWASLTLGFEIGVNVKTDGVRTRAPGSNAHMAYVIIWTLSANSAGVRMYRRSLRVL